MFKYNPQNIRNFSIIAHIDHGKSTLADRLLELTQAVPLREMQEQYLDTMDLEREKGITIKAHPVSMFYKTKEGEVYQINFIDTPGHVDFSYEVSRSLSACEGALLVIDASQGVQAQTIANVLLAMERNLTILPVINKIDLPSAQIEEVEKQIEEILGLNKKDIVYTSAKKGIGIQELIDRILQEIPPPKIQEGTELQALVFDSHFDPYRGVMVYVRVMKGEVTKNSLIRLMAMGKNFEVAEVGIFAPKETPVERLRPGEVGYILANIKNTMDVKIGDTITNQNDPAASPLPGFKIVSPVVFAGIYPADSSDFEQLKDGLKKLQLNDSSLHVEGESTQALGLGFRCGFLGLLHLEIISERIQREFGLEIIITAPSVVYHFHLSDGELLSIDNPAHAPDPSTVDYIEEPWVNCHLIIPPEYLGPLMTLAMDKRGSFIKTETLSSSRLLLTFRFPLNEIITDFHDLLKSVTRGYGSFDYEFDHYEKSDIVTLEVRVNEERVDAFSNFIHRSKAERKGRALCHKLHEILPRQLFKVPIQAAIGGKIIARETLPALTKNVTAKCYGGDITRKRKLWEKQKAGKEKMRLFGKVPIPQEVFMEVLKTKD